MLAFIRNSLILTFLIGLPAYADEPSKDTLQLEGVWALVQGAEDGRTYSPESDEELQVTFTKTRMIMSSSLKETDLHCTFTADSSKNPAWIDITPVKELSKGKKHVSFKGKKLLSIYELKQNQLKLCMPKRPLPERPAKFEAASDSLLYVLILKRLE